jgi:hypothetical protein
VTTTRRTVREDVAAAYTAEGVVAHCRSAHRQPRERV